MSWASKRQTSILSVLIGLSLVPVFLILYSFYSKPPTCNDGAKNQNEVGVDCGGVCSILCASQTSDPIVSWKRLFLVDNGVYNVVAYIENPNADAGAENVSYRIRVLNTDGVSMYERTGSTVVPAKRSVPIVETGINLGGQVPSRVEFKLNTPVVWKKESAKDISLVVSNTSLVNATSSPRLTVNISNKDVETYKNIEVVGILYDEVGNALGASRTFLDVINGGQVVPLTFTWPKPFDKEPTRIEVIPKLFK